MGRVVCNVKKQWRGAAESGALQQKVSTITKVLMIADKVLLRLRCQAAVKVV